MLFSTYPQVFLLPFILAQSNHPWAWSILSFSWWNFLTFWSFNPIFLDFIRFPWGFFLFLFRFYWFYFIWFLTQLSILHCRLPKSSFHCSSSITTSCNRYKIYWLLIVLSCFENCDDSSLLVYICRLLGICPRCCGIFQSAISCISMKKDNPS